jgi:hypothetical protein
MHIEEAKGVSGEHPEAGGGLSEHTTDLPSAVSKTPIIVRLVRRDRHAKTERCLSARATSIFPLCLGRQTPRRSEVASTQPHVQPSEICRCIVPARTGDWMITVLSKPRVDPTTAVCLLPFAINPGERRLAHVMAGVGDELGEFIDADRVETHFEGMDNPNNVPGLLSAVVVSPALFASGRAHEESPRRNHRDTRPGWSERPRRGGRHDRGCGHWLATHYLRGCASNGRQSSDSERQLFRQPSHPRDQRISGVLLRPSEQVRRGAPQGPRISRQAWALGEPAYAFQQFEPAGMIVGEVRLV